MLPSANTQKGDSQLWQAIRHSFPKLKKALDQFKMEAATEVGVTLNQGYNGDLTARQAGSIGGQMVKKMIQSYETGMQGK